MSYASDLYSVMRRHKVAKLSDMKNAIYDLTSDVTVTSSEMGLATNLYIISAWYSDKCVQNFAYLRSRFAEILREK